MNVSMEFDDLFGDRDPSKIIASKDNQLCFPLDSYKLLGRLDKTLKDFFGKMPGVLEKLSLISEGLSNDSNLILVVLSVR